MRGKTSRILKRAKAIQLGMLPDVPTIPGLEFNVHYSARDDLGGDFYDFVDVGPFELGIVVADVSGHGLDAALLMAGAKKAVQIHGRGRRSPAETLKVVCDDLAAELPANSFITMFYGVLDLRNFELTYVSAGHNPPILVNNDRKDVLTKLTAKGVVMGPSTQKLLATTLQEEKVQLKQGDVLVVHTDGLTEALSPGNKSYGEERLHELLLANTDLNAANLVAKINGELVAHRGGVKQSDDLTILAIRCVNPTVGEVDIDLDAEEQTLPGNLSVNHHQVLGRQLELKGIEKSLEECACVAVTGPGGIGKSQLAREYTRQKVHIYKNGVWTVDCSSCTNETEVAERIAEAMEVPLKGSAVASLAELLRFRRNTALILDDVDRATLSVQKLEALSSKENVVHVITTSLNAPEGLEVCPLEGLKAPSRSDRINLDVSSALEFPSVQLFARVAELADPEFELNADNVREIAEICSELHGLPLAIELAAKNIATLNPERICKSLKAHTAKIGILTRAGVDTSEIFRTVQWSFELLSDAERDVVLQLSIFRGGFFVESAERVVETNNLLNVLEGLSSRGVLKRKETPYGSRLQIYGPMGEYARIRRIEKLAVGQGNVLQERYVSYFDEFAVYWYRVLNRLEDCKLFTEAECLDRIQYEYDNLRDVHAHTLRSMPEVAAHCSLCAASMLEHRSSYGSAGQLLDECIDALQNEPGDLLVELLTMRARTLHDAGDTQLSMEFSQRAIAVAAELPTTRENIRALLQHAVLLRRTGELDAAAREYENVLELARKHSSEQSYLTALAESAVIRREQGRNEGVIEQLEQSFELAEQINSDASRAGIATHLGTAFRTANRLDEALAMSEKATEYAIRLGNNFGIAGSYNNRAIILTLQMDYAGARGLYEKAVRMLEKLGNAHAIMSIRTNCAVLGIHLKDYRYARKMLDSVMPMILEKGADITKRSALFLNGVLSYHEGDYSNAGRWFKDLHEQQLSSNTYSRGRYVAHFVGLMGLLAGDKTAHEEWFSFINQEEWSIWEPIQRLGVAVSEAWGAVLSDAPVEQQKKAKSRLEAEVAVCSELANSPTPGCQFVFQLVYDYLFACKDGAMKVKVRCKYCKKRYAGAKRKIAGLGRCIHCGHEPFVWDRAEE
ncbi:MAG: SpoIIE family protein phosphatase [Planctomycetes bacterium]|nr:SpoIIE family protein phosphatase [Planctomycetota bacterium]